MFHMLRARFEEAYARQSISAFVICNGLLNTTVYWRLYYTLFERYTTKEGSRANCLKQTKLLILAKGCSSSVKPNNFPDKPRQVVNVPTHDDKQSTLDLGGRGEDIANP